MRRNKYSYVRVEQGEKRIGHGWFDSSEKVQDRARQGMTVIFRMWKDNRLQMVSTEQDRQRENRRSRSRMYHVVRK